MKQGNFPMKLCSGMLAVAVTASTVAIATADSVPPLPAVKPPAVATDLPTYTSNQADIQVSQTDSRVKKTETVYVNLDPTGKTRDTTVTDWIHSDEAGASILDRSDLKNIVNVKGEEQPIQEGGGLRWNLQGTDLYYQGKSSKKLPLEVSIRYRLDGKTISPQQIAGKSGHVEIEISFKNNSEQIVPIGGTPVRMYTPMLAATGLILPDETFRNVQVSDGTVISDGSNQTVAIVCAPGLEKSLNIGGYSLSQLNDLEFPETFVVSADATEFELGPIGIAVTSELPDLSDLDMGEDLDDMRLDLTDLQGAQNDLRELDPVRDLRTLFTDNERTEAAQLLVEDIFLFYDLNKDLLDILPKYITDENIKLYDRIRDDLRDSTLDTLLDDEAMGEILGLVDDIQPERLQELADDYKLIDARALRTLMDRCGELIGVLGTTEAQQSIQTLKALSSSGEQFVTVLEDLQKLSASITTDQIKGIIKAQLISQIPVSGYLSDGLQAKIAALGVICQDKTLQTLARTKMDEQQSDESLRYDIREKKYEAYEQQKENGGTDQKDPIKPENLQPDAADGNTSESHPTIPEVSPDSENAVQQPQQTPDQPQQAPDQPQSLPSEQKDEAPHTQQQTQTEAVQVRMNGNNGKEWTVGVLAAQVDMQEVQSEPSAENDTTSDENTSQQPDTSDPQLDDPYAAQTPDLMPDMPDTSLPQEKPSAAPQEQPSPVPDSSNSGVSNYTRLIGAISRAVDGMNEQQVMQFAQNSPDMAVLLKLKADSQALMKQLIAGTGETDPDALAQRIKLAMDFSSTLVTQLEQLKPLLYQCFAPAVSNLPENEKPAAIKKAMEKLSEDIQINKGNFETLLLLVKKLDEEKLLDDVKYIDELRQDMRDLRPILKSLRKDLKRPDISKSLHKSPETTNTLLKMKNDLETHRNITETLRWAVKPVNVDLARGMIGTLDRLEAKDAANSGIQKLDDIDELTARKDALVDLSEQYGVFTQAAEGMDTEVKFIMKTDEIKRPEKEEQTAVVTEEKGGFISWLKGFVPQKKES